MRHALVASLDGRPPLDHGACMPTHPAWPRRYVNAVVALLLAVSAAASIGCGQADVHEAPPASPSQAAEPTGTSPREGARAASPPEARNPVQAEMRLLTEATRDWVTAIAQHDLASIPDGIARVHAARLVTEAALEDGTYLPPKGGAGAVDAFVQTDEAFHDELVKLLQAAKANDLPAATRQLGVVLEGCTTCHIQYRF